MREISCNGINETIYERSDFTKDKIEKILKDEIVGVIGYGVQGRAQSLNMKDNGVNVIVGIRKTGKSWDLAVSDGWVPGETLFEIEECAEKATIIQYLLSDAGQIMSWHLVSKHLTENKCLYFSHGFSITYSERSKVIPPKNIDVVLVAPKGSGTSVRRLFVEGKGINSSFAVYQDYTGKAKERCLALGIAIGSAFLFETTFKNEVYSDLTGERGVLMGAIYGIMHAQYKVLRAHGHTPSEAFNETVEEATQSLIPLISENGMDWMYANCSTTAQRGALDWYPKFEAATSSVFEELYQRVASGEEAQISIDSNSKDDYREQLGKELKTIADDEMWQIGKTLRELRPERQK